MIEIDVPKIVEEFAKQEATKRGIQIYDIDSSNIRVKILGTQIVSENPKVCNDILLDEFAYKNCSQEKDQQTIVYSKKRTDTFSWQINAKIKWGQKISASLPLPSGVTIGGEASTELEISGGIGGTKTDEVTHQYSSQISISGCSDVRLRLLIRECRYSGVIEAKVVIEGIVRYKVSVDWGWDVEESIGLKLEKMVDATFEGVTGLGINVEKVSQKAQCPQDERGDCKPS